MSGTERHATAARIDLRDSLAFHLTHLLPLYFQGSFRRRRLATAVLGAVDVNRRAVRLVERLRRRHRADCLRLRVFRSPAVLMLGERGIRNVLDRSPEVYADPPFKRKAMSHFQPHALTISRGRAWRQRRRFHEEVLDNHACVHRDAGSMLEIVRDEVMGMLDRADGSLRWRDFDSLFQRIMLQVVFGRSASRDDALVLALETLMSESNRGFLLRRSATFDRFYATLRRRLQAPEPGSLSAAIQAAAASPEVRVEYQVPHWMFALKHTLSANTAAALALIAIHPAVDLRLRSELAEADLGAPSQVAGLNLLGGCLEEAMRLWPTTPVIVREAVRQDTLGDETIAAGTQILIFNLFNHRDRARWAFADRFAPEIWIEGRAPATFLHFSGGMQSCVGQHIARFIGKAVLATLLERERFVLRRPTLDPSAPLPYSFDPFRMRLERRRHTLEPPPVRS